MKCIINRDDLPSLKYDIGYLREKRVKNCYYFNQKYFFFFCENYCEDFSLIKSSAIVEGNLSEMKPFVEFINKYKDQMFHDPGNNTLMGILGVDEEYLMSNLHNFSSEMVFFPPMTDEVDLKGFEIDVDVNDGVNPYFSAQDSKFAIVLAGVSLVKFSVIGLVLSLLLNY